MDRTPEPAPDKNSKPNKVVRPAPPGPRPVLAADDFNKLLLMLKRGKPMPADLATLFVSTCEHMIETMGSLTMEIDALQADRAVAQVLLLREGETTIDEEELKAIPAGMILRIRPVAGEHKLHVQAIQKTANGLEVPMKRTRIVQPN